MRPQFPVPLDRANDDAPPRGRSASVADPFEEFLWQQEMARSRREFEIALAAGEVYTASRVLPADADGWARMQMRTLPTLIQETRELRDEARRLRAACAATLREIQGRIAARAARIPG